MNCYTGSPENWPTGKPADASSQGFWAWLCSLFESPDHSTPPAKEGPWERTWCGPAAARQEAVARNVAAARGAVDDAQRRDDDAPRSRGAVDARD